MFKKIILSLVFSSGIISTSAYAIYFNYAVLQKDDITAIVLGDLHSDLPNQKITRKQTNDVLITAKKYDACCILEDADTYDGSQKNVAAAVEGTLKVKTHYLPNSSHLQRISPLFNFTSLCRKNNVPVYNSECRHSMLANLSMQEQMAEIRLTFAKIQNYKLLNTNALFQQYREELTSLYTTVEHQFAFYQQKIEEWEKQSFLQKIKNIFTKFSLTKEMKEFWKSLYDYKLFELNVLCDFYTALTQSNKKVFIICVGQGHCDSIIQKIQSIAGFRLIEQNNEGWNMLNIYANLAKDKVNEKIVLSIVKQCAVDIPEVFKRHAIEPLRSKL